MESRSIVTERTPKSPWFGSSSRHPSSAAAAMACRCRRRPYPPRPPEARAVRCTTDLAQAGHGPAPQVARWRLRDVVVPLRLGQSLFDDAGRRRRRHHQAASAAYRRLARNGRVLCSA
ncbi:hypothetical protein SEVIR_9G402666v4 [Setaria viridis]|uniref:Uncharacterized protein n=1 Tax=Setaria viridis TaxID=4556 RepID=A0A4U6TFK3_SETVI|nr:hypothetical protein SEVIR_9G402666v2 [Setaria viridis]